MTSLAQCIPFQHRNEQFGDCLDISSLSSAVRQVAPRIALTGTNSSAGSVPLGWSTPNLRPANHSQSRVTRYRDITHAGHRLMSVSSG